jgi:hypothetical protein
MRHTLVTRRVTSMFRARGKARWRPIRIAVALAAILAPLSLTLMVPPPAMAASTATCTQVYFYGVHGLNEGSSGKTPGTPHWGMQVNAVWNAFVSNLDPGAATALSANYPESVVDLPKPWGPGLPKGPSPWTTLFNQILSLPSATNSGAAVLATQMWDRYFTCPDASLVVAGYSQGAWVIDKALRMLSADGPAGKAVLGNVKGVFLLGDPAWANSTPHQQGIASKFGKGYGSAAAYLANGIPKSRFFSICAAADPICNWSGISGLEHNLSVHVNAYTSGHPSAAADGGNWLAAQLGSAG